MGRSQDPGESALKRTAAKGSEIKGPFKLHPLHTWNLRGKHIIALQNFLAGQRADPREVIFLQDNKGLCSSPQRRNEAETLVISGLSTYFALHNIGALQ